MRLADGVHFCESDGFGVFLDLRAGRYRGVAPAALPALRAALAGDGGSQPALAPLRRAGLVVDGEAPPLVGRPRPHAALATGPAHAAPLARSLGYVAAAATAAALLRARPLGALVARARRRLERCGPDSLLDDLARRHAAWRSLVYGGRDACLLDALVLVEYARRHRLRPDWVIGVRALPFAAHCWVEADGVVLNDSLERVRAFTPIVAA